MPHLSFFRSTGPPLALPAGIKRTYISSSAGQLELLSAEPSNTTSPRQTPLFFAHGGCGSAAVWLDFMNYFSQKHDIPCYAVSYRGHGSSWAPSFLRMYFTTKWAFTRDLVEAVKFVQGKEGRDVVLVAHSAGGGISQLALSEGIGNLRVKGLALMGALPAFGSLGVNMNWARMDPWMLLRLMFMHFGNPMSPLSSTRLVKQAFFCDDYPVEKVVEFEKRMPPFESFFWPNSLMLRFASVKNVLQRINGWGLGERVLLLAGEKDRLVTLDIKQKEAREYREAFKELVSSKKIEAKSDGIVGSVDSESTGDGVRMYVVKGAGHHLQNDLQWKDGADKLLQFYEKL